MFYNLKLWQKIFIVSFLVSIFLFTTCGAIITISGHKLNLDYEKNIFLKYLTLNIKNKNIEEIIEEIKEKELENKCYITLKVEDKTILDTLPIKRKKIRYKFLIPPKIEPIYLETIEKKKYLTSKLVKQEYELYISKDISYIYDICDKQLQILLIITSILSIFSGGVVLITSKILTKPIDEINKAIKYINKNDYSYKIPISNSDELNVLCQNFNSMTEIVEKNIYNYKMAINNFTHEVKSPLTSMIGYSEIILSDKFPEKIKKEAAEYIFKESKRLNSLITKIIDFLTIGQRIEMNIVSFVKILDIVSLSLKRKIEDKKIQLVYPKEKDYYFIGDEELLIVLFTNFIDNAIKASYSNSKIEIFIEEKNKKIFEVLIKDYGKGIPKNEIANITEVFYTLDRSRNKKENSLGLGLAICNEIIKKHKGKLKIISEIEKGTSIIIKFEKS